ncbi:flavoprotein [Acinetobacter sp. CWB-B33]|uniref:flavoprotein n=1 Tax=Acinetobacter sp. CWB-B33 TaxID=2815724 RepID=UPI0031FF3B55
MDTFQKDAPCPVFKNLPEDYAEFQGDLIQSDEIKQMNFMGKNVAIINIDQNSASLLSELCDQASQVAVFQIHPHFVLPKSERFTHKLIQHPLFAKNRRLFNNRIKSLLALRFLEDQVKDTWLKHLLMPNTAIQNKVFLKADHYYASLQRANCTLVTWPIVKIHSHGIQAVTGHIYACDCIIYNLNEKM